MLPRPPPEKKLYWFPGAASAVHDPLSCGWARARPGLGHAV